MNNASLTDTQIDSLDLPIPSDNDEELLVAYLDDEMTPYDRQEFENRLAIEPKLREKMVELDRSWKALDMLGVCSTSKEFVGSTMELIAVQAESGLLTLDENESTTAHNGKISRLLILAGSALLCAVGGYFAVDSIMGANPNSVYEDLPIIEKLDQYLLLEDKKQPNIDEIEFLKKLKDSNILD